MNGFERRTVKNSKKRTPDVVARALAETNFVHTREVFEVQVLVRHYLCPFLIPMVTKWQNKFIVLSCYSSFVDLIFKKIARISDDSILIEQQ